LRKDPRKNDWVDREKIVGRQAKNPEKIVKREENCCKPGERARKERKIEKRSWKDRGKLT
jgi:hypothetical protein